MKKQFFLSFSLILVVMSFSAVPLQTAYADGNINGNARLTFANCSGGANNQCRKLTLTYHVIDVNPQSNTQMIIRIKQNRCKLGEGNKQFIDAGQISTKDQKDIRGSIPAPKNVSLTVRDRDTLLFCLSRGNTLVAQGTFKHDPSNVLIQRATVSHV